MSVRTEKFGDELHKYLVSYADYLARSKRSVAGLLNGAIYNIPFTVSNRPALRSLMGKLSQCEDLLADVQKLIGEIKC